MNKSRSLLLLSVLAVLFAACEEGIIDNAILSQDYTEPEYAISVSPGELSFPAEGGEEDITLELTRSLSWTATTNDSWITLPTHSGDDSPTSVIHILVAENTSLESRTGTITFKTRGKTATLTVKQEGVEPFLSTDVQTLTFPSDGGAQQVQISTNGNWTATTKAESAFSVSPTSGTGEGTLTVTAAENETTVLRWETLTLTSGTLTVSITLLQQAKPDLNGHAYVDLGLPSGLLWATCNVGATTPEEYGDYFAWGETAKKNSYTWANYKWSDGSMQSLTKYNNRNDYGIVDNLSELLPSDDAAVVNWGGCWRMPTYAEWEELCNTDNCTWTPLHNNGHCEGYKVTSTRNGNSIFLPAAGLYTESGLDHAGLSGYFWASTLFSAPDQGCGLYFDDAGHPHAFSRYQGLSVRPVGKMALHFSLMPTSVNFPAAGSSETLSITANQPWTVTTSDTWLTLSADAGTGDATLDVAAEENTSITRRSGTVTFSAGGNSYIVNVTQTGIGTNKNYLTFEALENSTFTFSRNDLQYSLDGGTTWTTLPAGTASPTVQAGERIMWKAELTPNSSNGIGTFSSTGKFNAEGNIMSLLYGDDFVGQTSLSDKSWAFYRLFYCTWIVNAGNLVLPATTLAVRCYYEMFKSCSNLTSAPELPATTLASNCYGYMFEGCTSLTTAPELPATTLTGHCYEEMFCGCTSLTTAPELPATTLANSCYNSMFSSCTSLTTAPELPATTLDNYCYAGMFSSCTSLTTAPELPATTLVKGCYEQMFNGCTNLTTAPELPSTTLADYCYEGMFRRCTNLTTAPELPATTLSDYCYASMFYGCTSLTTAPELPATTLANDCYYLMFSDCYGLTSAPELPATTLADYCYLYMFYRCTSLTIAPDLPATTLAMGCYCSMFRDCSSLVAAPDLPASTLTEVCYLEMFKDCTSLITAPELPATTLAEGCYRYMFEGCTKLNYIKCLATDISANQCTDYWVTRVASSGTFVKNASMTRWTTGTSGIPSGWTVQNAN